MEQLGRMDVVLVFYEAPHRILESLADAAEVLGPRDCVLTRELTKLHEEFLRGTPEQLLETLTTAGVHEGRDDIGGRQAGVAPPDERPISEAVDELIGGGISQMEAIKAVARNRGLSKREVYTEYARRS